MTSDDGFSQAYTRANHPDYPYEPGERPAPEYPPIEEDREYAAAFADALMQDHVSAVMYGVHTVETFREAMIATGDAGLVVEMEDGARVHITVQAWRPVT